MYSKCSRRSLVGDRREVTNFRRLERPKRDDGRYRPQRRAAIAGIRRAVMKTMIEPVATGIERYMTLLSVRQRLVASNIANADTPGYHTMDVDFQHEFQNAMNSAQPEVTEVRGLYVKNDGNNVSIDRESRLLSENDLRFALASNLARSELKAIRMAMDNGSQS